MQPALRESGYTVNSQMHNRQPAGDASKSPPQQPQAGSRPGEFGYLSDRKLNTQTENPSVSTSHQEYSEEQI